MIFQESALLVTAKESDLRQKRTTETVVHSLYLTTEDDIVFLMGGNRAASAQAIRYFVLVGIKTLGCVKNLKFHRRLKRNSRRPNVPDAHCSERQSSQRM
jgi:hypothetical protein